MIKSRDTSIDYMRGFAALIVVFGHSLQRFSGHESSAFYNIIFSFQMPLFMFLSGYVTHYSREIKSLKDYVRRIRKRSLSLLLPWSVWSCIVFLLLSERNLFDHICYAAFHMEHAYWFLFSLWTIDLIYSTATLLSAKIGRNNKVRMVLFPVIYLGGVFALLILGLFVGITFLGIKYSLYYSIFFVAGLYVAKIDTEYELSKSNKSGVGILFSGCLILYCLMIRRFNIIQMPDKSFYLLIRGVISLSACLIIYLTFKSITVHEDKTCAYCKVVKWAGSNSLELYVVHYIIVRFVDTEKYSVLSIDGFVFCILYFLLVLLISFIVIKLIDVTKISKLIFFGKRELNKGIGEA